ncbi:MAG: hypothetical protein ACE149_06955 [Armatimonadota bacterium]
MVDKVDVYDALAALIPGTILVCLVPVLYPAITKCAFSLALPDGFAVVALVAVAVLTGHIVQAFSSWSEAVLWLTWGGRPSDVTLAGRAGARYFPKESADRIRAKLAAQLGGSTSERSLFLYASQIALAAGNPRVERFNALYGYHRGLFTLSLIAVVMFGASTRWGAAAACAPSARWCLLAALAVLAALFWYRTKQRGYYHAREVLGTAERVLDGTTASAVPVPTLEGGR